MQKLSFPCGCSFNQNDNGGFDISLDPETINYDCKATWDYIGSGDTIGLFQINSQLGQQLSSRLKPENIHDLAALTAIMRPGCLSCDTIITTAFHNTSRGTLGYNKHTIEEIFKNKHCYPEIISFDETNRKFIKNKVKDVVYQGKKKVYKIKYKVNNRSLHTHSLLECTDDHKILTNKGWKEAKNLVFGDRICVVSKRIESRADVNKRGASKTLAKEQCWKHYEYKCTHCDWLEGSLDVNHIDSNNKNNDKDNLNYFCPNHHREFTENRISIEDVKLERRKYTLPEIPQYMVWAIFTEMVQIGIKDTYDIIMEAPHHNFIAGNVVVHNCMEAMYKGKSITDHYIDVKNGVEKPEYLHSSLEPILKNTRGQLIYQESVLEIAKQIAGFTLQEADNLRKGIGKKLAEVVAKIRQQFIDGCKKTGIVDEKVANELFDWIEKGQRYLFNASHSYSYGIVAYQTAYSKAHFFPEFITANLIHVKGGNKSDDKLRVLVNNCKRQGLEIRTPDFRQQNDNFMLKDGVIWWGLTNVKGVGGSSLIKIREKWGLLDEQEKGAYLPFLLKFAPYVNSSTIKALASVGAFSWINSNRTEVLHHLDIVYSLTERELGLIIEKGCPGLREGLEYLAGEDADGKGPVNKKRRVIMRDLVDRIVNPKHSVRDSIEWIAVTEESLLGVALTCSKVDACEDSIQANCTIKEYLDGRTHTPILAVEVLDAREITIKNGKSAGQKMAFLKVADGSCSMDSVTLFNSAWSQYKNLCVRGNTIMLLGRRDQKRGSLLVEKIWQLL